MKESIIHRCLKLLLRDWKRDQSRASFHYAFAIKKNKIIAIGKNKPENPSIKAQNLANEYNIKKWKEFPYLHAESDLITKINKDDINRHLDILSLRINRHGEFRLAKPCINCQSLLDQLDINKIHWSCTSPEHKKTNLILNCQQEISANIHKIYCVNNKITHL